MYYHPMRRDMLRPRQMSGNMYIWVDDRSRNRDGRRDPCMGPDSCMGLYGDREFNREMSPMDRDMRRGNDSMMQERRFRREPRMNYMNREQMGYPMMQERGRDSFRP